MDPGAAGRQSLQPMSPPRPQPLPTLAGTASRFSWTGGVGGAGGGLYWPGLFSQQAERQPRLVRRVELQRINGVFGLSLIARADENFGENGGSTRFFVSAVATGSSAQLQEIQPGDEVLKLDSRPVIGMSLAELGSAIRRCNRMELSIRTARASNDSDIADEIM